MNVQTKIEASTLLGALARALPELEAAKKNSENAAFKQNGKAGKYADLASILEAIRPISAHGLWFRQVSHEHDNGVSVETFYIHDSGELSAGKVFVPADKNNAHGYGSAQSYARRYGLQLAFGLATEDDDGNAASSVRQEKPAVVNDVQWGEITSLMQATNTDAQAFCKAYRINSVKDLPADAFERAKKQLNTKLSKMKDTVDA